MGELDKFGSDDLARPAPGQTIQYRWQALMQLSSPSSKEINDGRPSSFNNPVISNHSCQPLYPPMSSICPSQPVSALIELAQRHHLLHHGR